MENVFVLKLGAEGKGSSILSIHASEAGALGAFNNYLIQHPGGPKWKLVGERMWKSGANFLLIDRVAVEA